MAAKKNSKKVKEVVNSNKEDKAEKNIDTLAIIQENYALTHENYMLKEEIKILTEKIEKLGELNEQAFILNMSLSKELKHYEIASKVERI